MPARLSGHAAPFPPANIDTDVIMPKRFLRTITREGLAEGVLADLRFHADGTGNPDFILNQPAYKGADILVVGDNFGCGSSREHAVWGLKQLGIKAIIGTSFAGIFYDNARKNLLVLACIPPASRDLLLGALATAPVPVEIDLEARILRWSGQTAPIEMDEATQTALVQERDDIRDTLALADHIKTFEAARPAKLEISVPK